MKTEKEPIICPKCGARSGLFRYPDTVIKNFPLYCKKCKQESKININAQ